MKNFSSFLVNKRYILLSLMLILTVISAILMSKVNVITDMAEFLPDDSAMKQGLDIMESEFSDMADNGSIRVMTTDLSKEENQTLFDDLAAIKNVETVYYDADSEDYNKENHSLFILNTKYSYESDEMKGILQTLKNDFASKYNLVYVTGETELVKVPLWVIGLALLLLLIILLVMCNSWFEPILFIITIGIAVLINMGTNAFLNGVSETTHSIGAILQLVLSMDYSIILINRYRQELASPELKSHADAKYAAMKNAITGAASSITSSALTTIVGLLSLIFISFKIGTDMGIVLAKGVAISMISILTVLPALILFFDKIINKTAKKTIHIPMNKISSFSYKGRYVIIGLFIVFFVVVFLQKSNSPITYSMLEPNDIDDVFKKENQIIVLYDNKDEENISQLVSDIEQNENVKSISAYSTTLGREYTAAEMAAVIASMMTDQTAVVSNTTDTFQSSEPTATVNGMNNVLNVNTITLIYGLYHSQVEYSPDLTMSLEAFFKQLLMMASNPSFTGMFDASTAAMLQGYSTELENGKKQLVGTEHSLMVISTDYDEEGLEAHDFLGELEAAFDDSLSSDYYFIGNSPMQYEMSKTFKSELNKISIITAIAIFIVVLFTFRSFAVPAILIAIIQSAVYATMLIMTIWGSGIFYLALLMVQSILMGATIDYAIVFTTYYREGRKTLEPREALTAAYNGSIHTILTSGLIMVIVTWILGYIFPDPSVGQICHLIAIGVTCALVLIIFVLPGVLTALDRFTKGKNTTSAS